MVMRFESGGMVLQSYWNQFQRIGAWLDALSAPIDADFKQASEERDVLRGQPELDDLFN